MCLLGKYLRLKYFRSWHTYQKILIFVIYLLMAFYNITDKAAAFKQVAIWCELKVGKIEKSFLFDAI